MLFNRKIVASGQLVWDEVDKPSTKAASALLKRFEQIRRWHVNLRSQVLRMRLCNLINIGSETKYDWLEHSCSIRAHLCTGFLVRVLPGRPWSGQGLSLLLEGPVASADRASWVSFPLRRETTQCICHSFGDGDLTPNGTARSRWENTVLCDQGLTKNNEGIYWSVTKAMPPLGCNQVHWDSADYICSLIDHDLKSFDILMSWLPRP